MTATIETPVRRGVVPAPAPGIYPSTPMPLYHAWDAASNSRLSRIRQSPAHLKAYMDAPPEDTVALMMGRAIHTAILEPDDFDARFCIAEQCTAITKDGKGPRCNNSGILFDADRGWLCGVHAKGMAPIDNGRIVLKPEYYDICLNVRDNVYKHAAASRLLRGEGDVELSCVWKDSASDVTCKARWDRHSPLIAGGAIVDIKSTVDASRNAFERAIFSHGYHRQGALYLDSADALGIPTKHFVIIAVEKEPPYALAVYRLTEGAIDAGREQLQPLLQRYATCLALDEWPGYPEIVDDIALPAYAWQQIEEEVKYAQEGA